MSFDELYSFHLYASHYEYRNFQMRVLCLNKHHKYNKLSYNICTFNIIVCTFCAIVVTPLTKRYVNFNYRV